MLNKLKFNKKTVLGVMILTFVFVLILANINDFYSKEDTVLNIDVSDIELSTYSDDYLTWLEYSDEEKSAILEPKKYITYYEGQTAYSYDFGYLDQTYDSVAGDSTYSSYYNLAATSYAAEIKNQGLTNLCWAFSASTVFEIQLNMSGYGENSLSSLHISNALAYSFTDYVNPYGVQNLNVAGNFMDTFLYWSSGMGPVEDFSYSGTTSLSAETVLSADVTYKVDTVYDLPYFDNSTDDSQEDLLSYISLIKEVLTTSGGLTFHSASPQSSYGYTYDSYSCGNVYNSTYYSVYAANDYDFGCSAHAMVIVGWDDDFSAENFNTGKQYIDGQWVSSTPSIDGAWIVQNSWGTYGDSGYVYYSYDDAYLYQYLFNVASVSQIDYDYIYQYNPTGALATFDSAYGEDYIFVNSYDKSSSDEYLTEISFYISQVDASESIDYTIYVNSENGDVTSSSMIKVQSLENAYSFSGYYTVTLDEPILLTGDSYAVGVEVSNAKIYLTLNDSESLSDNEVGLSDYQSFYIHYNAVYTYNYANFIKAYTNLAVSTNDLTVDTTLKYDIDEDFSDEVITVKSLTYSIDSGEILEYRIKNSSGEYVTNDFTVTTNVIMSNLSISLIELTSSVSKDLYTVETYYDNVLVDKTELDLRFMELSVSNVSFTSKSELYGQSDIYDLIGGNINFTLSVKNIYEDVYIKIIDKDDNLVLKEVIKSVESESYTGDVSYLISDSLLEAGTYSVVVTVEDETVLESFSLTVKEFYAAKSISLLVDNLSSVDLYVGDTLYLSAVVTPSDAMNNFITYVSSDESVATVSSDGLVTVVGEGSTDITAYTSDPQISSTLSVLASDPKISIISYSLSGNYLYSEENLYTSYGGEVSIIFEANYEVGDTLNVLLDGELLDSSEYSLKSYDEYYVVVYDVDASAVNDDYELLVQSTLNNSNFSVSFSVLEYNAVDSVSFSDSSLLINIDDTPVLEYVVNPSDATNKEVLFSSSNELVAVVSTDGKITALSSGEVIIKVCSKDDESICDEISVTIVNELVVIDEENSGYIVTVYNDKSYVTGIKANDEYIIYSDFVKNFTLFNAVVYDNGVKVYNDDIIKTGNSLVAGELNYTIVVTGDLNGDGLTGSNDVLILRRYLVGIEQLDDAFVLAGDINGSGLSSYDALLIRRYLVGLGEL